MIYYTAFFILTYCFSRLQKPIYRKDIQRTRAFFIGILMLLLMGLRDRTVAGDTITYVGQFLESRIQWTGFEEFFLNTREPLFSLVVLLCQRLTSSYTIFLFVTSLMVVIGFSKLLEKYSDDMFLSMLMFCGIGSMYFCMAGIRQAMAMGCTMIAFRYAKNRKLFPFLLWCLIAYGFHNSAIVFVFVYLFVNSKSDWKGWIAVGISVILGMTKSPFVMEVANIFTTKEYEMDEVGLNYTLFFIQLVFVVFCYVYGRQVSQPEKKRDFNALLNLSVAGLCFQALTPVKGEFFRVSSYFSVYLCMAIPKVLSEIERRERLFFYVAIAVGLLGYIYIFGNVRSYHTFF